MFNSRGEGSTAHQNIMDRIQGSRETWSDVNSPRVDNRWDPGISEDVRIRNVNENAIHDNPDRNIDTPQAGPPPGGPQP